MAARLVRDEGGRRFKSCHSDQHLTPSETSIPTVSRQIRARGLAIVVASSWRTPPSQPRASPRNRPRFLVSHLIGNRASFLCTKAPMRRVISVWHRDWWAKCSGDLLPPPPVPWCDE